jgi:hypothetical protein
MFPRPRGNGAETKKPLIHKALGNRTLAQYKALPHSCRDLPPTHEGLCCQMGTHNLVSQGLVYERATETRFDKDFIIGKRPKL